MNKIKLDFDMQYTYFSYLLAYSLVALALAQKTTGFGFYLSLGLENAALRLIPVMPCGFYLP